MHETLLQPRRAQKHARCLGMNEGWQRGHVRQGLRQSCGTIGDDAPSRMGSAESGSTRNARQRNASRRASSEPAIRPGHAPRGRTAALPHQAHGLGRDPVRGGDNSLRLRKRCRARKFARDGLDHPATLGGGETPKLPRSSNDSCLMKLHTAGDRFTNTKDRLGSIAFEPLKRKAEATPPAQRALAD